MLGALAGTFRDRPLRDARRGAPPFAWRGRPHRPSDGERHVDRRRRGAARAMDAPDLVWPVWGGERPDRGIAALRRDPRCRCSWADVAGFAHGKPRPGVDFLTDRVAA